MRWERVHVNARARETPEGKKSAGRKGGIWGPGRRWGHTCNSIKGGRFLYVFGGYGKDNCQTNDVHVFDSIKQTWSKPMMKGIPPCPRDSHTCNTVGNNLFMFGGTDGRNPLRDLFILDTYANSVNLLPASNTWIMPNVRGEIPEAREGHSAALVDKRIFVFGGCGKSFDNPVEIYYNDLYIFDTEQLLWERAVTHGVSPSARDSHTCSAWKNKIIILGGEDASDYYLSDVHVLDTNTLVWKELHTSGQMLAPRAGHSTVSLGKYLFVLGGFTDDRSLYDDLHVLNLGMSLENGQDEQRTEKFSYRKELKKKCQDQNLSLNRCDFPRIGMISNSSWPVPPQNLGGAERLTLQPFEFNPSGQVTFEAQVKESFTFGYTIEAKIDGKPLRGILFSSHPSFSHGAYSQLDRKRTSREVSMFELRVECEPQEKMPRFSDQTTKSSDNTLTDDAYSVETTSEKPMEAQAPECTDSVLAVKEVSKPNSLPSMDPKPVITDGTYSGPKSDVADTVHPDAKNGVSGSLPSSSEDVAKSHIKE
ncbi:hypothetical protein QJS10_CPB15g01387 [Acorus calamus]|uniref:Galactose oxidase/kelch repeat superfamily protein n=1 Tax=Acorus calamus TaxID=4465 RepID=A0AAV9D774_ACOCL|nr:hypothetical protein QJS10_CPB15g01387 [Acorus calamus]